MQGSVSRHGARRRSIVLSSALLVATSLPALAQGVADQFNELRNGFGLGKERAPIDFTERPPLVVPPTNNLPPPGQDGPALGVNDPDLLSRRKALADPRRPVPPSDPGASATGLSSRPYLIDPPSGMRDPAAVAASTTTDTSPSGARSEPRHRKAHKRTPAPAPQQ